MALLKHDDTVTLKNLSIPLSNSVGLSAFSLSSQPCTILITITCHLLPECISASAVADDLPGEKSVNYSSLGKRVYKEISEGTWASLDEIMEIVGEIVVEEHGKALGAVEVVVDRPRALLFSRSVSVSRTIEAPTDKKLSWEMKSKSITINNIRTRTIIGLNPHERLEKQELDVDVEVDVTEGWEQLDYKGLGLSVLQFLDESIFHTLEALSLALVKHALLSVSDLPSLSSPPSKKSSKAISRSTFPGAIEVRIRKPSAMAFAECPMLTVKRSFADFEATAEPASVGGKQAGESKSVATTRNPANGSADQVDQCEDGGRKKAYIAIGTNLGDRIDNIQKAIMFLCSATAMDANDEGGEEKSVKLGRTSRLYESQPMYVEDQGKFMNAVFEISTKLEPLDLLRLLKRTESHLGRVKTIRNGPRIIDLDLIMYGTDEVIQIGTKGDPEGTIGPGCGWLKVPHWGIGEREFVVMPLMDLLPGDFRHPALSASLGDLYSTLPKDRVTSLLPVIPFRDPSSPLPLTSGRPLIMGILNCTPDSFSDGEEERVDESALEKLLTLAKRLISEGADILDVGGMSTRPGVKDTDLTEDEELGRIIPVIQALRLDGVNVPISVDTFRAAVAEQAILAGASCINDVRGGRETGMLEVMAKLDVPVILMHSRGTSITMTSDEAKDYTALGGVVKGVKTEMAQMVSAAEKAGIKRWNLIVDPGIGFAKTLEGNLQLLRGLPEVLGPKQGIQSYTTLVGASRKGFIGTITDRKDPKEREFGTAAITAICCGSGMVDIIRVHEPGPSLDVIKMLAAVSGSGGQASA